MKLSEKQKKKIQKITKSAVEAELERRELEKARSGLFEFVKYTKPNYKINWHNKVLCQRLDRFLLDPEFSRLMIFAPPRHGKTEIASRRLPAYAFGLNSNINIISTSYSADLAQRINRDVQRIIDDKAYSKVFPDVKLSGKNVKTVAHGNYLRNSDIFEIVDHAGVYRGAGVGGGITGMGFDLGIIDDPFKNWKEANSQTVRDAVWEWYTTTFYTRGEGDEDKSEKIIIIMTRWHEDDLAGRLIKQMEEDPEAEQWEIISLPAIYEGPEKYTIPEDPRKEGEALWPKKRNEKRLAKTKKTLGSYLFNALYQQKPSPPEGSIWKRDWWRFYKEKPGKFDEIIQSWDLAFKKASDTSYVVGQVWGKVGANKYLLDQVRAKMGFIASINAVKTLSAKWPKTYEKLIEDKANGPAVIEVLHEKISGLIPVSPGGSKTERAIAASPCIESGNAYLPDPSIAPWIHDFIEECAAFPNAAHDDQVDAASQALNRFQFNYSGDFSATTRPRDNEINEVMKVVSEKLGGRKGLLSKY